jgi:nitrite reductase/ring-hydroxylating ferredoxin subunit
MCEKDSDGFIPVFEEKDLQEGTLEDISVQDLGVLLIKLEGKVYAISNACPHNGRILTDLHGYYLYCKGHGLSFDIRTGESEICPDSEYKLVKFDCKVKDGKIWIKLA